MLEQYDDIICRLGKPKWWDEVGCPRYDKFQPNMCNDIYAEEALLMLIACQQCHRQYKVAMSWKIWIDNPLRLSWKIKQGVLPHYGDPPCFECSAGATMNCEDLQVLEFWERNKSTDYEWRKNKDLEIEEKRE